MTAPKRVQMTRQRPWRAEHPDAVIVARPSKWGNPIRVSDVEWFCPDAPDWRAFAVDAFRRLLVEPEFGTRALPLTLMWERTVRGRRAERTFTTSNTPDDIRRELAGRDLACWCPLDQPCHADVLLDLANPDTRRPQ